MAHLTPGCNGIFVYGKSSFVMQIATVKRQCSGCGVREVWNKVMKRWDVFSDEQSKADDGDENWIDKKPYP